MTPTTNSRSAIGRVTSQGSASSPASATNGTTGLPATIASPPAALRGIFLISLIYLGNLLFGWLLSAAQVKSAIAVGQGAMNDLRLAAFEHIQRLSLNYFDKTHQGRILSRADTTEHLAIGIMPIVLLLIGNFYLHGRYLLERPANSALTLHLQIHHVPAAEG